MKAALLALALLSPVSHANCKFIEDLSMEQRAVAQECYLAGAPYNLGKTAVAIGWQESKLGKWKVRFSEVKKYDKSVGIGHTNIYYATKNMTALQRGIWIQQMIQDNQKSIAKMIQDLLYWQSQSEDWKGMVQHYNAGWHKNPKYLQDVVTTIDQIKSCKWTTRDD